MPARIEAAQLDITSAHVDAIVNAANEALQLGAGVAGAIRTHGGPTIQEECDRIGHCGVGQAVVTGAGTLPARWVIHSVGPVWRGGQEGEEIGAKSVALPMISTGVFGFPIEIATRITVAAARAFAQKARSVERIVFCLPDEEKYGRVRGHLEQTETSGGDRST